IPPYATFTTPSSPVCRAPKGPRKHLIVTRASIHGFLVFDRWHRRSEALQRLSRWHRTGHIRFKEDVLEGIEYIRRSRQSLSIKAICLHEESGHALGLRKCLK